MSERFTTPFVKCLYPYLQQPKVNSNGDFPDAFEITLVFGKDDKKILTQIANLHKEGGGKQKVGAPKHPIKFHTDSDGNVSKDEFRVRFRTKAEFCDHVPTFDAQGNKILRDKNFVGYNSIVRVNWTYKFYKQGGGGVSLFLNGVQIKELIERENYSAADMGFDETEGYGEYEKPETNGMTEPPPEPNENGDPQDDDDLPF